MTELFKYDVFLSHNRADKPRVRAFTLSASIEIPRPWEWERVAGGRVRVMGRKQTSAVRAGVRWRSLDLASGLTAADLRVWFDEWEVPVAASRQSAAFSNGEQDGQQAEDGGALPRRRYGLAIERGLEASRTRVLRLSPVALGSDWVGLERNAVGRGDLPFRDPTNAGCRFIHLVPTAIARELKRLPRPFP
jgi:hypothetical protein